jgi:hypothetical protein
MDGPGNTPPARQGLTWRGPSAPRQTSSKPGTTNSRWATRSWSRRSLPCNPRGLGGVPGPSQRAGHRPASPPRPRAASVPPPRDCAPSRTPLPPRVDPDASALSPRVHRTAADEPRDLPFLALFSGRHRPLGGPTLGARPSSTSGRSSGAHGRSGGRLRPPHCTIHTRRLGCRSHRSPLRTPPGWTTARRRVRLRWEPCLCIVAVTRRLGAATPGLHPLRGLGLLPRSVAGRRGSMRRQARPGWDPFPWPVGSPGAWPWRDPDPWAVKSSAGKVKTTWKCGVWSILVLRAASQAAVAGPWHWEQCRSRQEL